MSKDNIFQRKGRRGGGGGKRTRGHQFHGQNGRGRGRGQSTWAFQHTIFRTCPNNVVPPQTITRTIRQPQPQQVSRNPNFAKANQKPNPFFASQINIVPRRPGDFQHQQPLQQVLSVPTIRRTIKSKPSFHSIIQSMVRLLMKHGAYDRDGTVKKVPRNNNNGGSTSWNVRRQDAQIVNNWQSRQGHNAPTSSLEAPKSSLLPARISRNSRGKVGKTIIIRTSSSTALHKVNNQPSSSVIKAQHSSAVGLDGIIKKCTGGEHSPFTTYELFDMYNQCIDEGIDVPMDEADPL